MIISYRAAFRREEARGRWREFPLASVSAGWGSARAQKVSKEDAPCLLERAQHTSRQSGQYGAAPRKRISAVAWARGVLAVRRALGLDGSVPASPGIPDAAVPHREEGVSIEKRQRGFRISFLALCSSSDGSSRPLTSDAGRGSNWLRQPCHTAENDRRANCSVSRSPDARWWVGRHVSLWGRDDCTCCRVRVPPCMAPARPVGAGSPPCCDQHRPCSTGSAAARGCRVTTAGSRG